ncbi:sensor histidine kinase [Kitasatospora sp. NPDC048239]|uniref:sensor histidine kinase n=1 Tax=Kitasatospora sp. NPDC048239 TaxID=3364046 RepID=UPI0037120476
MPGISAPRTGHRAGRSGSLRSSLLALVLAPCLGLAAAWGYAAYLLRGSGHRDTVLAVSAAVAVVLLWSLASGVRTARTLPARLAALRSDTLALARHEIPEVVGRLRSGETLAAPPAWAPARRAGDELQQTADGLAAVRQAAVAAIVHQAQGREGTKKVFLNIARRTQILIHRQISMLDALEREHEDPELLRELFAVDHLATRMRRNAENLVILGGALPARRWRNAVPVVNVLRSAVSETENYSRVVVQGVPRVSLSGQAVADVIHLVAELIENGTTFSPPYTQVQVSAQEVPKGLAVEVEDRGLGMTEEEYERLNDYLANPPELDVSVLGDDLRLGLFVVARLAARHAIQVSLRPSPYGGARAVVLVPAVLLEQAEQASSVHGLPSGARVTRTPVPQPEPVVDGGNGGNGGNSGAGGFGELGGLGGVYGIGETGRIGEELSGALAGMLGGPIDGGPAGGGPIDSRSAGGGAPGADGGGALIGELLATRPPGAAPAHDGLPVGSPIPGIPGAVVVPRPAPRLPYDTPNGGAHTPGGLSPGLNPGPNSGLYDGSGGNPGAGPAAQRTADPGAPTHERAQGDQAEHGPDGELRTPRVLPRRVRNASLAEQLREAAPGSAPPPPAAFAPAPAPAPTPASTGGPASGRPTEEDPSPQRSRATMAAIQHGTRTARAAYQDSDAPVYSPVPAAPSAAKEQQ